MPLYVGDYLADTAGLSAEEHGAYLLLIMNYWTSGKPLPDDNARLSRIAACGDDRWPLVRTVVARFFKIGRGLWKHKRIDAEIARAEANIEAKRRGANAKHAKDIAARASHMQVQNGVHNGVTPPPPSPSKEDLCKNLIQDVGGALRAHGAPRVNYRGPENEANRYAFARKKIAHGLEEKGVKAEAVQTLLLAADSGDAKALEICRAEARKQRVTYQKPNIVRLKA